MPVRLEVVNVPGTSESTVKRDVSIGDLQGNFPFHPGVLLNLGRYDLAERPWKRKSGHTIALHHLESYNSVDDSSVALVFDPANASGLSQIAIKHFKRIDEPVRATLYIAYSDYKKDEKNLMMIDSILLFGSGHP
ncbi:MAG: hypothetical protein EOP05_11495 [Proteobacteria bacterium]|nr:MAG: hypothetical protein EOP05_11495 [Pseudomonadota bacterium]